MPQVNEISWFFTSWYYLILVFCSFLWLNFSREINYFSAKFNFKFSFFMI